MNSRKEHGVLHAQDEVGRYHRARPGHVVVRFLRLALVADLPPSPATQMHGCIESGKIEAKSVLHTAH